MKKLIKAYHFHLVRIMKLYDMYDMFEMYQLKYAFLAL